MIKTLTIENFKGWKNTGNMNFSPITLFMGSNSSGKSSIGQFLMLLQQTCLSQDRRSVLYLGDKNSIVELGGPIDILYGHNPEESLKFEYKWNLSKNVEFINSIDQKKYTVNQITFNEIISVHDKISQTLEIEKMQYSMFNNKNFQFSAGMERVQKASSARAYKTITENYYLKRNNGRAWEMPSPFKFYGFPDEMINYHQNAWFAPQLNVLQEQFFNSICYLGPLRDRAQRYYRWTGNTPISVGAAGEYTIPALLAARAEGRKYNFKAKQPLLSLESVIAQAMKNMGLIENFEINRISEDRQDYDVKVKTKGSPTLTDVPDVGFGISQVLPVLVQLYYAPENSIIIMEQPELHLHPSAQSALADEMIRAISARENARPRNIQLIIETHSEHFLRRFQRRIAEKKISQDLFAAYFANNDQIPAILEPLQINLYGEIINWPKNFFGDINGDIFAQTEAALKDQLSKVSQ